jgi:hypothetical protein
MRGELRLVLAAQPVGDDDGEAAEDQAFRVDEHPAFGDLRGFEREGGFQHDRFQTDQAAAYGGDWWLRQGFGPAVAGYRAAARSHVRAQATAARW